MNDIVTIHVFTVDHVDQGLEAVAHASAAVDAVGRSLEEDPAVVGFFVLSTCNRVDIYVDLANDGASAVPAKTGPALGPTTRHREGAAAIRRLFRTASGLDSLVVGEREIAGQLRRATAAARQRDTLSPALARAAGRASAVSRRIDREVGLSGTGRSVVAAGLDLMACHLPTWTQCHALLFGTGSYAGAVVTRLQSLGVRHIRVHSASGRAEVFARGHGIDALTASDLPDALTESDLVVACRGIGVPVLTDSLVNQALARRGPDRAALAILDLSLTGDTAPYTGSPGVFRMGLSTIQHLVPPADHARTDEAAKVVDQAVADFCRDERARNIDAAVLALREHVGAIVEDEIARLRPRHEPSVGQEPDAIPVDQVHRALRHVGARLLHTTLTQAHEAARNGQTARYMEALSLVMDVRPQDAKSDRLK